MFESQSRSTAEKFFEPRRERLCRCIINGFHHYQEKHCEDAHIYEKRTKAGVIRDIIVDLAKTEFGFDDDVNFLIGKHDTLMKVGESYILRFKKLLEDLSTSNYPTPRAQAYVQQMEIPGIPSKPLRLEIGYLPDPFITEIKGIYIVCPKRWSLRLDGEQIEADNTIDVFDTVDTPPIQIKLKEGIKRKEATNGSNC